MKKIYLSWHEIESLTQDIIRQLHQDCWKPDYVVGITRGGLVPANLISQYLNIPMHTLKVALRDNPDCESNCWMSEDAVNKQNILIVDDINDSGATLNWIKQDWQASVAGIADQATWDQIWNNNVRIAVCINNEASAFKSIDYSALEINKLENPQWIVFPWENFWER